MKVFAKTTAICALTAATFVATAASAQQVITRDECATRGGTIVNRDGTDFCRITGVDPFAGGELSQAGIAAGAGVLLLALALAGGDGGSSSSSTTTN